METSSILNQHTLWRLQHQMQRQRLPMKMKIRKHIHRVWCQPMVALKTTRRSPRLAVPTRAACIQYRKTLHLLQKHSPCRLTRRRRSREVVGSYDIRSKIDRETSERHRSDHVTTDHADLRPRNGRRHAR